MHDALVVALGDQADAFLLWLGVDYPAWARANARDAEDLKRWCAAHETASSPPH